MAPRGSGQTQHLLHVVHDFTHASRHRQLEVCGQLFQESRRLWYGVQQQSYPSAKIQRRLLPILSQHVLARTQRHQWRFPQPLRQQAEGRRKKREAGNGRSHTEGVDQIKPVNPFIHQQAETTAATLGIHFEPTATPGNMLAVGSEQKKSVISVRGVFFSGFPSLFRATAAGHGTLEVHLDRPDGEVLASTSFNSDSLQTVSTKINTDKDGIHNLYFVFKGKD